MALLLSVSKAEMVPESVVEKKRVHDGWLFGQEDGDVTMEEETITFYIRNLKKVNKNQIMLVKQTGDKNH